MSIEYRALGEEGRRVGGKLLQTNQLLYDEVVGVESKVTEGKVEVEEAEEGVSDQEFKFCFSLEERLIVLTQFSGFDADEGYR